MTALKVIKYTKNRYFNLTKVIIKMQLLLQVKLAIKIIEGIKIIILKIMQY